MNRTISTDHAYSNWIKEIAHQFRRCQIKAAMKVNSEMLRFYWQLGKDLTMLKDEFQWGSKFYHQISEDLQKQLPDVHSFSPRNLRYMAKFSSIRGFGVSP